MMAFAHCPPDEHEAQRIVTHFNLLIYAWRMGRLAEAAKNAEDLFALGIVVQFPAWSRDGGRSSDE